MQTQDTLVTAIVLHRHTPSLLFKRCLNSIQHQSYTNIEIVVVDANSKDSPYSKGIIEDVSAYPDITYIANRDMGNLPLAKNAGIVNSHGEMIAFIYAKDYWEPDHILQLLQELQSDVTMGATYSAFAYQKENIVSKHTTHFNLRNFHYISQALFRRTCFEYVGTFDDKLLDHTDHDLWFRLYLSYRLCFVDKPRSNTIIDPSAGTTSITSLDTAIGYRQFLVKHSDFYHTHKQERKTMYYAIARAYRRAHHYTRAIQFRFHGNMIFPWQTIRQRIQKIIKAKHDSRRTEEA